MNALWLIIHYSMYVWCQSGPHSKFGHRVSYIDQRKLSDVISRCGRSDDRCKKNENENEQIVKWKLTMAKLNYVHISHLAWATMACTLLETSGGWPSWSISVDTARYCYWIKRDKKSEISIFFCYEETKKQPEKSKYLLKLFKKEPKICLKKKKA